MDDILTVKIKDADYENISAECPFCKNMNIFNRASDLQTFDPIGSRDVSCASSYCGKRFNIIGDSVNSAHEMLINNCNQLMESKRYMNCIIDLCMAYEVFFNLFFRVELIYKPFSTSPKRDLACCNSLLRALNKKIRYHTFNPMRSLFLWYMVTGKTPKSMAEAKDVIEKFPNDPRSVEPMAECFEKLKNKKIENILKAIKTTDINKLRNKVAHKQAYRPKREKVEETLKETKDILFPLSGHLQLYDDINWYIVQAKNKVCTA